MTTTVIVTLAGKKHYKAGANRRLKEEEVHELVQEALIGVDPNLAEINIYHDLDYIKR